MLTPQKLEWLLMQVMEAEVRADVYRELDLKTKMYGAETAAAEVRVELLSLVADILKESDGGTSDEMKNAIAITDYTHKMLKRINDREWRVLL